MEETDDSTWTLHKFNTKKEFWKKLGQGICVQFIPAVRTGVTLIIIFQASDCR